jgi:hypothetical protein
MQLSQSCPDRLSPSVGEDAHTRLPHDVSCISFEHLTLLPHVDVFLASPLLKSSPLRVGATCVQTNVIACVTPHMLPSSHAGMLSLSSQQTKVPSTIYLQHSLERACPRPEKRHWRPHPCPCSRTWIYCSSRHPRMDQHMLSVGTSAPLPCLPLAASVCRSPSHRAWVHPVLVSSSPSS